MFDSALLEKGSPFPSAMPEVSANRMGAPSAEARITGRQWRPGSKSERGRSRG